MRNNDCAFIDKCVFPCESCRLPDNILEIRKETKMRDFDFKPDYNYYGKNVIRIQHKIETDRKKISLILSSILNKRNATYIWCVTSHKFLLRFMEAVYGPFLYSDFIQKFHKKFMKIQASDLLEFQNHELQDSFQVPDFLLIDAKVKKSSLQGWELVTNQIQEVSLNRASANKYTFVEVSPVTINLYKDTIEEVSIEELNKKGLMKEDWKIR